VGQPFVGEIRLFAGNFAPLDWAFCEGQLLSIAEFEVLFDLIGTTYGGDGQTTFQLPDLRSRVPVGQGTGSGLSTYVIGQNGGVESVTLTSNQIPSHRHAFVGSGGGGSSPGGGLLGTPSGDAIYTSGAVSGALAPAAVVSAGGSQPHENRMPCVAISYIISLFGIFPSQS
jgi:microcystin-dependent protein